MEINSVGFKSRFLIEFIRMQSEDLLQKKILASEIDLKWGCSQSWTSKFVTSSHKVHIACALVTFRILHTYIASLQRLRGLSSVSSCLQKHQYYVKYCFFIIKTPCVSLQSGLEHTQHHPFFSLTFDFFY